MLKNIITQEPRKGCRDVWNAFMLKEASFSTNDIPFCPNTSTSIPTKLITYEDAHALFNKAKKANKLNFFEDSFVCWYIDDYKFDNSNGIWQKPYQAKEMLEHFAGIITPDFSCCQDFPIPLKMYNTYRMRAFGYWYGSFSNHQVINNVRWNTEESYSYCFDGLPTNSILAIGTVASNLSDNYNMTIFEDGLRELVRRLTPHTILVYGSSNYECFNQISSQGITIVTFPSKTSLAHIGGEHNV